MPSTDILKQMRGTGYVDKPSEEKSEEEPSGNRLIKLSEEEMQSFGENKGGEVECSVKGTMTDDGMFRVLSVSPAGGQSPDQGAAPGMEQMIQSVMGR